MNEIPRRSRIDQWTPAEHAIDAAMQAVEAMPADVRLTDAVVLLGAARDSVADYVDGIQRRRYVGISRGQEMDIESGAFHWRDGWYFSRQPESGYVRIKHVNEAGTTDELLSIAPEEWASIVASVSKTHETTETYQRAMALHAGKYSEREAAQADTNLRAHDDGYEQGRLAALGLVRKFCEDALSSPGAPQNDVARVHDLEAQVASLTRERDEAYSRGWLAGRDAAAEKAEAEDAKWGDTGDMIGMGHLIAVNIRALPPPASEGQGAEGEEAGQ